MWCVLWSDLWCEWGCWLQTAIPLVSVSFRASSLICAIRKAGVKSCIYFPFKYSLRTPELITSQLRIFLIFSKLTTLSRFLHIGRERILKGKSYLLPVSSWHFLGKRQILQVKSIFQMQLPRKPFRFMCLVNAQQNMFHYQQQKTLVYIKKENGTMTLAHLCGVF